MNVARRHGSPAIQTPQDRAIARLATAGNRVAAMLGAGVMTVQDLGGALRAARTAARILAPSTNVGHPLHAPLTSAVRDALRAVASLQTAWDATRYIDNGAAQALQLESLRMAHRLLDSALRSAATGTDHR